MSRLVFFSIVLLALPLNVSWSQNQEAKRVEAAQRCKTLDHLIESIDADDERERLRAVQGLRSLGELALPALPSLVRALEDRSISIRIEAAKTLGSFGPAGMDALPKLAVQLDNDEFGWHGTVGLAEAVATAIVHIGGPDNKAVVRRLITVKQLKTEVELIHSSYLRAFPRVSLINLIELLKDEDDTVREQAAIVIGVMARRVGRGEPLLSKTEVNRDDLATPLIAVLDDERIAVRIAIAQTLFYLDQKHCRLLIPTVVDALRQGKIDDRVAAKLIGPAANEATPLLIAALDHHDDNTQREIAYAIALCSEQSLPYLARARAHDSSRVRAGVAFALGCYPFREQNLEAAAALLPFLRDEDGDVRLRCAESIVGLGVAGREASVPVLIEFLNDKQAKRRTRAVDILGEIGPLAQASVPKLLRTLSDDHQDVRIHAAIALVSIDPSQGPATLSTFGAAIQPLEEEYVGFQQRNLQTQAVVAIGSLGPAAESLADEIVAILEMPTDKTTSWLQLKSAEALIKISDSRAYVGVNKLTELVSNGATRKFAIEALLRQSQRAMPAVDAILAFAQEERGAGREFAAVAAIKIDPDNVEAWQLLHRCFEQKSSLRVNRVVDSLVKLDVDAVRLLAELERILVTTHDGSKLTSSIILIGHVGPQARSAIPELTKLLSHERESIQQAARMALEKIGS
ncbi:MAG: HEAT repeat protein [Mariniblastus sp.]|jgi:HEAT repeat protein